MKATVDHLDPNHAVVTIQDEVTSLEWKVCITAPRGAWTGPGASEDVAVRRTDKVTGSTWMKVTT